MPRIFSVVNYQRSAGPERKQLSVKDKEINFDPKDLLKQIATIYVHLSKRDKKGLLAQGIVADKRSYYPEMFPDALVVKLCTLSINQAHKLCALQLSRGFQI